jgi:hypothetical protein
MTKTTRARYTLEFKQEAVRLGQGESTRWAQGRRQQAGECRADGDCPAAW